jgi:hypothetical protein
LCSHSPCAGGKARRTSDHIRAHVVSLCISDTPVIAASTASRSCRGPLYCPALWVGVKRAQCHMPVGFCIYLSKMPKSPASSSSLRLLHSIGDFSKVTIHSLFSKLVGILLSRSGGTLDSPIRSVGRRFPRGRTSHIRSRPGYDVFPLFASTRIIAQSGPPLRAPHRQHAHISV